LNVVLEALRCRLQQQITRVPPEAVVDLAEMHDIEGDYGRSALERRLLSQALIESLTEQRSLGEPCQRIERDEILGRILVL